MVYETIPSQWLMERPTRSGQLIMLNRSREPGKGAGGGGQGGGSKLNNSRFSQTPAKSNNTKRPQPQRLRRSFVPAMCFKRGRSKTSHPMSNHQVKQLRELPKWGPIVASSTRGLERDESTGMCGWAGTESESFARRESALPVSASSLLHHGDSASMFACVVASHAKNLRRQVHTTMRGSYRWAGKVCSARRSVSRVKRPHPRCRLQDRCRNMATAISGISQVAAPSGIAPRQLHMRKNQRLPRSRLVPGIHVSNNRSSEVGFPSLASRSSVRPQRKRLSSLARTTVLSGKAYSARPLMARRSMCCTCHIIGHRTGTWSTILLAPNDWKDAVATST